MQLVYLDANAIEDAEDPRTRGVDPDLVQTFLAGIRGGQLLVPLSDVVIGELLSTVKRSPQRAYELGRFYRTVVCTRLAFRASKSVLGAAVEAMLHGASTGPLKRLTVTERQSVSARLRGEAHENVEEIVAATDAEIDEWMAFRTNAAAQAKVELQIRPGTPLSELVATHWDEVAQAFAESLVAGDLLERVRGAGREGALLGIPAVRAAVGASLGIACADALNQRKPDRGDFGDSQHCLFAASSDSVLVTRDGRLTKLANAIPGGPVKVMDLAELTRVM